MKLMKLMKMNYIIIIHNNFIYKINKEPFETDENTYIRAWFLIKNYNINDYNNDCNISNSIIYLNEYKNNMKY
jgi:hypothetical protein